MTDDFEGSIADGSFGSHVAPLPMLLWGKKLDKDNFDDFIGVMRSVMGRDVAVYYGYDSEESTINFFAPDIK